MLESVFGNHVQTLSFILTTVKSLTLTFYLQITLSSYYIILDVFSLLWKQERRTKWKVIRKFINTLCLTNQFFKVFLQNGCCKIYPGDNPTTRSLQWVKTENSVGNRIKLAFLTHPGDIDWLCLLYIETYHFVIK